jgi:hypothetical protein
MSINKQDERDKGERKRVQRVLNHHKKKYGTSIEIKGKSTDVYPKLKGELNWDWVCYDTETGEEIAVEVKKITEQKLEEKVHIMWQLLAEVANSLSESKKLPGTFYLSVEIPQEYNLPFNRQGNKQKVKGVLSQAIYRTAQSLKPGKTKDLKPQIIKQLPFVLPDISVFDLHKFSNEGSMLHKGFGTVGFWSIGFDKLELQKFNNLVLWANEQLKTARVQETLLVLVEEGQRPINPSEIEEAFTKINAGSYSKIRHVYFIRGKEITEIPLPTPHPPNV